MNTILQSIEKVFKNDLDGCVYKDVAKRIFILDFLRNIPIENLEELVNFTETDLENMLEFRCKIIVQDQNTIN